jgi:hypothetical protein
MNTVLQTVVVVFGVVICAMSVWGIFSPDGLIRIVKRVWDAKGGIYAAVIVRLLLGAVLILVAGESRFPTVFMVLGVISVVAALVIPFMKQRMSSIIAMLEDAAAGLIRVWLLFGMAFGAFLIYGVL